VRAARSFILNFFKGKEIDPKKFDENNTTPVLVGTGGNDKSWDDLKVQRPNMWKNDGLIEAGNEFSQLIEAQRQYIPTGKKREG
jgi:hypothetical protein